MLVLVLCGVVLFFIGATFFLGAPALWTYAHALQFREPRTIICPETQHWADVSVDGRYAVRTELAGHAEFRLLACSRWPARQDCDQACAAQLPLVGDDRRATPYAAFGLAPQFLRVNHPVRMDPALYARLARQLGRGVHAAN